MEIRLILILVLLVAGCATKSANRQAIGVKPVVDVQHGMEQSLAYYHLGRHYQSEGLKLDAESAYAKALGFDPDNREALSALGLLNAERGEYERALQSFRRLAELTPAKADVHNNIAYALYLLGRFPEAISSLRTALTLDPGYERAWINLGRVAGAAGMTELASAAAQRKLLPAAASPAAPVKPSTTPIAAAVQAEMFSLADLPVKTRLPDASVKPAPTSIVLSEVPFRALDEDSPSIRRR